MMSSLHALPGLLIKKSDCTQSFTVRFQQDRTGNAPPIVARKRPGKGTSMPVNATPLKMISTERTAQQWWRENKLYGSPSCLEQSHH